MQPSEAPHVHAPKAPELRRQRAEVFSSGFDDFAELTGSPPIATGLRVPPLVGPTYRFLACVAELSDHDELVGLRQFAKIAAYLFEGDVAAPPFYPEVRPIETPGWHFADTASIVWTVTLEPLANFVRAQGPFDQLSFVQYDTTGPALVYNTAAFPLFPILPGYLGLSAYTPPAMRGKRLLRLSDIRFPQTQNEFFAIRRPIEQPTRVRVYIDVQQTNPSTRFVPTVSAPPFPNGLVPEEQFLQDFPSLAVMHTVGAALVFDRNRTRLEP